MLQPKNWEQGTGHLPMLLASLSTGVGRGAVYSAVKPPLGMEYQFLWPSRKQIVQSPLVAQINDHIYLIGAYSNNQDDV